MVFTTPKDRDSRPQLHIPRDDVRNVLAVRPGMKFFRYVLSVGTLRRSNKSSSGFLGAFMKIRMFFHTWGDTSTVFSYLLTKHTRRMLKGY